MCVASCRSGLVAGASHAGAKGPTGEALSEAEVQARRQNVLIRLNAASSPRDRCCCQDEHLQN